MARSEQAGGSEAPREGPYSRFPLNLKPLAHSMEGPALKWH